MPWLLSRKRLISLVLIDLFLFLSINFYFRLNFHNDFSYNGLIFLLPFWTLTSYIVGRYTNHRKELFIVDFFKSLMSTLLVNFVVTIIYLLIFLPFSHGFDGIQAMTINLYLINIFSSISFFIQFFALRIFRTFFIKSPNWYFIGSEETLKKLRMELNKSKIKAVIKSISFVDKTNFEKKKLFLKCDGLIIEDIDYYLKNGIFKFLAENKLNIPLWTISLWCSEVIQRYPSSLLTETEKINLTFQRFTVEMRIKRLADISLSILILILAVPFFFLIYILIKIEDGGPFLYYQNRNGLREKIFRIYKIRSMKVNSEKDGVQWSKTNDSRITKVGKILRLTRIDELPQLFSVIIGDMSLIGPRPERPEFNNLLNKQINNYSLRHLIKPGLSGWAQVNFPYGASIEDTKMKLSYDFYYIKNFSIFLDFLIFFKTIKLVSTLKGALPNKNIK